MPTSPPGTRRSARLGMLCEAIAVLAFVLLVLRDQYGVAWLQAYDQATFDGAVLAGLAGATLVRAVGRRTAAEGRMLAARVLLLVVTTGVSLVAAEYLARLQYRRARTSGNAGDYIGRSGG